MLLDPVCRPQMPESQHDSAPAVSHEILEAQLLRRNRHTSIPCCHAAMLFVCIWLWVGRAQREQARVT